MRNIDFSAARGFACFDMGGNRGCIGGDGIEIDIQHADIGNELELARIAFNQVDSR